MTMTKQEKDLTWTELILTILIVIGLVSIIYFLATNPSRLQSENNLSSENLTEKGNIFFSNLTIRNTVKANLIINCTDNPVILIYGNETIYFCEEFKRLKEICGI